MGGQEPRGDRPTEDYTPAPVHCHSTTRTVAPRHQRETQGPREETTERHVHVCVNGK